MGKDQSPKLIEEKIFLEYLDQREWTLKTNLPHWLLIAVPQWRNARWLAENFSDILRRWATATRIYFQYGQGRLAELSNKGELMKIAIAGIPVNRQLLDVFGEMLNNADRSIGLVRLSDERQLSVSGGANGKFLVGASIETVTQWKREDYWHPQDLAQFNKDWRQQMSVGSNRWYEYRYRSFDPLANDPGPHKCDYTFITKYRLIEGPDKILYHLAENVDMVEIG